MSFNPYEPPASGKSEVLGTDGAVSDRIVEALRKTKPWVSLVAISGFVFGGLSVSAGGARLPAEVAHIARDPLDPLFDDERWLATLRRRRTGVKRALLDQTLLSLVQSGDIDPNDAFLKAQDKKEFMLYVTQPDLLAMVDPAAAGGPPTAPGGERAA